MERDRLVRLNGDWACWYNLAFGTCPTIFAILYWAIIYKGSFKNAASRLPFPCSDIFKILMIALGTFMLIYFEGSTTSNAAIYFIYHWWRAGLSFSDRVDRRISNH